MKSYEKASRRSWRPSVAGCQTKKRKTVPSPEEQEKAKKQGQEARRQWLQERRQYDETVGKACFLKHIKDPHREKSREVIRNRVDSYSRRSIKSSSGLMHLVKGMYEDVMDMETVEVPEEFFDKTYIRHLMLGRAEAQREKERIHVLTKTILFTASRVLETRVTGIFTTMGR
jgi:hypothetical protein